MGLIKAATGAAGGVLADQWREYFYCDALPGDVLVAKGQKRTSGRSSNTHGEANIISNGSIVAVNEGQCMMIVEQGAIVEFCAEAGEFVWDSSTEPTMLYGGFGAGLKGSWDRFKKRFTMGGDTGKDQRVYFFNTKEIPGNKYGTPSPVPFRVVDRNHRARHRHLDPLFRRIFLSAERPDAVLQKRVRQRVRPLHARPDRRTAQVRIPDRTAAGLCQHLRPGHPLQRAARPHGGACGRDERRPIRQVERAARYQRRLRGHQLRDGVRRGRTDDQGSAAQRRAAQSRHGRPPTSSARRRKP